MLQESVLLVCHTFFYRKCFHSSKWQFWNIFEISKMRNNLNYCFFWFRSRSFLVGLAKATQYVLTSFATKTYYNVEMWLSLPGATLFYGSISFIGYDIFIWYVNHFHTQINFTFTFIFRTIVMYFIMPETEGRSLAEIELHYSDNTKGITDIYIHKNKKLNE